MSRASHGARARLPELPALRQMFSSRGYLLAYVPLGIGIAFLYTFLLPGLQLQSLAPWVLRFLTPAELLFALTMGILLPLVILLNVYLWRHPTCCPEPWNDRRDSTTVLAALVGLIPNLLCCTPIVPVLLAVFLSGAALLSISAPIQHALNVYAWALYAIAALGIWGSLRMAARRMSPAPIGETETVPV